MPPEKAYMYVACLCVSVQGCGWVCTGSIAVGIGV